jgi:hypothetical protein
VIHRNESNTTYGWVNLYNRAPPSHQRVGRPSYLNLELQIRVLRPVRTKTQILLCPREYNGNSGIIPSRHLVSASTALGTAEHRFRRPPLPSHPKTQTHRYIPYSLFCVPISRAPCTMPVTKEKQQRAIEDKIRLVHSCGFKDSKWVTQ